MFVCTSFMGEYTLIPFLTSRIKTGWSTVAARKKSRPNQMKLPPQDVKHIQEVVAQAEALQMAEELRIG